MNRINPGACFHKRKGNIEMENKDIREQIKEAHVCYWMVAHAAGIFANTLTIWMRKPLDHEKHEMIQAAIGKAAEKYGTRAHE